MMTVCVFLVTVTAQLASATSGSGCEEQDIEPYVAALTAAHGELAAGKRSEEPARRFFRTLPESFVCFYAVFGYPDDKPGPLYSEPQLHDLFPRLAAAVPRPEFVRKLVRLSVHGRWEADQTGALQDAVRAVLEERPSLFLHELKALNADDEYSTWQFLFGAPHPSNEALSPDLQRRICSVSKRSCALQKKAYAAALAEEERP